MRLVLKETFGVKGKEVSEINENIISRCVGNALGYPAAHSSLQDHEQAMPVQNHFDLFCPYTFKLLSKVRHLLISKGHTHIESLD